MRILFIGGDKRMDYAAEYLTRSYDVERLEDSKPDGLFDVIVLPLPLTKNKTDIFAPNSTEPLPFDIIEQYAAAHALILAGGECNLLSAVCEKRGYTLVNYFANEPLTLKNAALTAEAACAILAQSTDGALLDSSALIIGFGRIARYLAARLRALGCGITVAARREEQRVLADLDGYRAITINHALETLSEYDFIANTAPAALFAEKEFLDIANRGIYMELASLPNAEKLAESCGARYIFAGGLPGKCSPKAAGKYIADELSALIKLYTAQKRDQ